VSNWQLATKSHLINGSKLSMVQNWVWWKSGTLELALSESKGPRYMCVKKQGFSPGVSKNAIYETTSSNELKSIEVCDTRLRRAG
jgi:hypothetical protein